MSWSQLLANKEAQRHTTSKQELDNMRELIARDLADSAVAQLSADRRQGNRVLRPGLEVDFEELPQACEMTARLRDEGNWHSPRVPTDA